jgi:hypothetical protein
MIESKIEASDRGLGLNERRAFMKLPLKERQRQLAEQAAQMVEHYERRNESFEREEWLKHGRH